MRRRERNGRHNKTADWLGNPWRMLSLLGTALGAVGAGFQLRREWQEARQIKEGQVYDLTEAARLIRVEEGDLLEDVLGGVLPARAIGDRHLVLGEALLNYLRGRHCS